jgi:hypothetical protein
MRWLRSRRRRQKNTRATSDIAAAAPPTTPPMIAPVWLAFADSGPSVVVGAGKMVAELRIVLEDVDELERVFEDVLCEDVLDEVIEDAKEGEGEEDGIESVVGVD